MIGIPINVINLDGNLLPTPFCQITNFASMSAFFKQTHFTSTIISDGFKRNSMLTLMPTVLRRAFCYKIALTAFTWISG